MRPLSFVFLAVLLSFAACHYPTHPLVKRGANEAEAREEYERRVIRTRALREAVQQSGIYVESFVVEATDDTIFLDGATFTDKDREAVLAVVRRLDAVTPIRNRMSSYESNPYVASSAEASKEDSFFKKALAVIVLLFSKKAGP